MKSPSIEGLLLKSPPLEGYPECSDGVDNDGDGLLDWQYDLGCVGDTDDTEYGNGASHGIGVLDSGWTVFEPSSDTRIMYVSSSTGNNSWDGRAPEWNGTSGPVRTPGRAGELLYNEFLWIDHGWGEPTYQPDWILYKRGDVWNYTDGYLFTSNTMHGRSPQEPFVISSYGNSTVRPRMIDGSLGNYAFNNLALVGLSFERTGGVDGTNMTSAAYGNGVGISGASINSLVEDCYTSGWGIGLSWDGSNNHIRRNIIVDSYSTNTHAQGYIAAPRDTIFEENFVDHNGWHENVTGAQPTIFNHNFYVAGVNPNVTFRNNIISRGAATGAPLDVAGIHDNNLFIDNAIHTFSDCSSNVTAGSHAFNNVYEGGTNIDGAPRGMGLAGSACNGKTDQEIKNNLFIHKSCNVSYGEAISMGSLIGDSNGRVEISNNVIYGWCGNGVSLYNSINGTGNSITISNNIIQKAEGVEIGTYYNQMIAAQRTIQDINFTNNTYISNLSSDSIWWFVVNEEIEFYNRPSADQWANASGETDAHFSKPNFYDPSRSVGTYMAAIGQDATKEALYSLARKQSKYNWNEELTAAVINEYIRAGFDMNSTSIALPVCGDGIRGTLEQCDDGNTANGDGCSSLCKTEIVQVNIAPKVNAGADISITLPSNASLSGKVTDDGLPSGSLTYAWTTVSGPGTVTFASPSKLSTSASFNVEGTYVLRLTASDGQYDSSDTLNITVSSAVNQAPNVSITNPLDGGTFSSSDSITITASASDSDGTISKVEFYDGAKLLISDTSSPYSYSWSSASIGAHTITAVVTDDDGATKTSSTISITVQNLTFLDMDNDEVNDLGVDLCLNTPIGLLVNIYGCPLPKSTEFTKLTPEFKNADLFKTPSPVIGNVYGEIHYTGQVINLLNDYSGSIVQQLDLDAGINIGQGKISLNPTLLPNLDKPAYLTFYNINAKQSSLVVKKNSLLCTGCKVVSYDSLNKILLVYVPGFSDYEIESLSAEEVPKTTTFDHVFPPLDEVSDISSVSNLEIGDTRYASVKYTANVSLVVDDPLDGIKALNLDNIVKIEKNKVTINSSSAPSLNKEATITMYGISLSNPRILKDGQDCPSTECTGVTLSNGVLTFNVKGFSTYEAVETSSPTPASGSSGSSGGGGSYGSGGSSGGGISRVIPTTTPEDLRGYLGINSSGGISSEPASTVGAGSAKPATKGEFFGIMQIVLVGLALGLLIVIISLARRMSRQRVEG